MKFWPRSLIARILLLELGAIAIAAVALPMLLTSFLRDEASRYEQRILGEQARAIAHGVTSGAEGPRVRLDPVLTHLYASPYDGRAYVVTDGVGRTFAESPYADLVPWRGAPRKGVQVAFRAGAFVGVSQPVRAGAQRIWVIVTQDRTGPGAILDDVVHGFIRRYDPVLVSILLLLPLINSALIARLFFAVRDASQQAAAIGSHNLGVRLDEAALPLEVAPLAHATNDLLARLQASFRNQSEFVANVAHELRTPLTVHRVELEAVEDPALRARLRSSVDRLSHVVAQVQDLATLEVMAEDRFETFDAGRLAQETIGLHAPQIFAAGDTIALDAPDAPVLVRGNPVLAGLALANLITNASRHTPAGTAIEILVAPDGVLLVRDDGPGIAASNPQDATERYWRADHQRSDGAGLGLSIVRRIMDVHKGRLVVQSRSGEGTCISLRFPLAPAEADVTSPS
ncbi:sensor histidine kinase [Sphingomonas sp. TDK1]|uniref:sensor histidine kinase n=1 Tax=Sphingomonas sp. TDK1 TaxID=453247 RepID=UPI0007D99868|nr:HAMP domain-containing sensor histidine kinase [Sphingomonas sp. TDK1]OAN65974.1 two-component sensor histidine kinase [Sphingomonas sp. TDK1]